VSKPFPFAGWINLAERRLGAEVVSASDEFFAPRHRLISPQAPVFIADKYDDHGKWMDGWESRRKRTPGHDHCLLHLGQPGLIQGFDVDTTFFTGNYPPEVSIEGRLCEGEPESHCSWTDLTTRLSIGGDQHNYLPTEQPGPWNWLRLNIYPDGGVARLRVYGKVCRDWAASDYEQKHDLAAIENGGRALACNDMHFGAMDNLIAPGRGLNMGDGWETRRRREPGNDWVILALGHAGIIDRIEVDTAWFKGNYPDRCSIDAVLADPVPESVSQPEELPWQALLPEQALGPDAIHTFTDPIIEHPPVNLVRLNIYPDGGVSRLRLFGRLSR